MADGMGAIDYHERTKHTPRSVREEGHRLDFDNKPRPYKVYEDRPASPLAETIRPSPIPTLAAIADPGSFPPATATDEVDLDTLTQACYYSAGITRRIRRRDRELLFRAAACTGALYHVDLYVVLAPIGDLDAGVYHFDPRTLSLDRLRTGDFRARLADATGDHAAVAGAPVSIVLTSTWWRNAWKYRARTYRHAFWDAGTVIANLLAIAHSLDLPASVLTGFADTAVAALVGVDLSEEGPIAVVPIGEGSRPSGAPPMPRIDPETRPLSDHVVEYPLIHAAYIGSALSSPGAVEDWRSGWPTSLSRSDGGEQEVGHDRVPLDPVPDHAASKVPLYRTIARRGSCRAYRRDELNFRKVSTVLDRATRGVPLADRPVDAPAIRFNEIYCLVNGLDDVEPGRYRLRPDAGVLERLDGGEVRQEAGHLALDQRLGADAALSVYFMTDLNRVVDRLGDRSYRVAQLEAAITAGRLYLGAYAHRDLGATGLTFYDDAVTDFFSPWAAELTPMFLWTLGRPA